MVKKKTKKIIKKTRKKKSTAKTAVKARKTKKVSLPQGRRVLVEEIKEEPQVSAEEVTFEQEKIGVAADTDLEPASFSPFEIEQGDEDLQGEPDKKLEQAKQLEHEFSEENENSGLTQQQKNVIMYTSIVTIMAVVVVFWVFAVRNSLSQNLQMLQIDNTNNISQIGEAWDAVRADVSNLKSSISQQGQAIGDFTAQAKTQIVAGFIKNEAASDLKNKLENLNVDADNLNQILNTNSVQ